MKTSWQKNFFYSTIMVLINVLVPLISYPYLTRTLGPDSLGRFNFAFAIVQIFFCIAQMGLPFYGSKEIAKLSGDKENLAKRKAEFFTISVIITAACGLAYILLIFYIPRIRQDFSLFLWFLPGILLVPFSFDWFFQGIEHFRYLSLRNITTRLLGLLLMFFIIKEPGDYPLYGAIMSFVWVGHFAVNIFYSNRISRADYRSINLKRHIRPLLLTLPASLFNLLIVNTGCIILGFLAADAEVSYFFIPVQVTMIMSSIVIALSYVVLPRLSAILRTGEEREYLKVAGEATRVSQFLAIPMSVGAALLSVEIIRIFAGESFAPAGIVMMIGAFRIIPFSISGFTGLQVFLSRGEEMKFFFSVLSGVIFMILLNLVLVPFYGAVGTMVSAIIAESLICVLQYLFGKKYFTTDMFFNKSTLRYLAVSLLFIPVCIGVKSMGLHDRINVFLTVILCTGSYFIMLSILKDPIIINIWKSVFTNNK